MTTFESLGLTQQTLNTLSSMGFETPTPIQEQAIPLVMAGNDLIGLAQTGTGKTAAFGLPLVEHLIADKARPTPKNIRALILAPTRELVNQIAENLKSFTRGQKLFVGLVVGGASINNQVRMLSRGVDILIATPGRLLDLVDRKAVSLSGAHHLVLDEADQMLDLGFVHDLRKIARMVPAKRQTLLFSATMPKQIAELAREYLTDPVRVEVTPPGKTADRVEQSVHFVAGKNEKVDLLRNLLASHPDGLSLVFGRTKHGSEKLMKQLVAAGFKAASIHGNKSQGQRERALRAFRNGETRVLVATDVAARGIDIPEVTHVYNFDLPEVADIYVHRIGRTARAGREGLAIAMCAPDEMGLWYDIEKVIGQSVPVASGEPHAGRATPTRGNGRGGRGGAGNRGGNGSGRPQRAKKPGHRGSRPQGPATGGAFTELVGDMNRNDANSGSGERRDRNAKSAKPNRHRPEAANANARPNRRRRNKRPAAASA